ncbi:hypothetical protein AB1M95_08405 [Sulfitobacter sp. LCG007]
MPRNSEVDDLHPDLSQHRDIADLLDATNWEQRLEEARARRERLLAHRRPARSARATPAPGRVGTISSWMQTAGMFPDRPRWPGVMLKALTLMFCCLFIGIGFAAGLGLVQALGPQSPAPPSRVQADSAPPAPLLMRRPPVLEMPLAGNAEAVAQARGGVEPTMENTPSDALPKKALPDPAVAELARALAARTNTPWPPLDEAGPEVQGNPRAAQLGGDATPSAETDEPTLSSAFAAAGGNPDDIALRLYAPQGVPEAVVERNLSALEATGFRIASTQRVRLNISTPHLRYYAAEDAALSEAIGQVLGVEARNFSEDANGSRGLIEVWLDGKSAGTASAHSARAEMPRSQFMADLNDLREHLARKLR